MRAVVPMKKGLIVAMFAILVCGSLPAIKAQADINVPDCEKL